MHIKSSTIQLRQGIYILRHPAGGMAPISVTRAPGGVGKLDMLATAGTEGAVLRNGSDCIVLHVRDAAVEMLVTAFLPREGAPVPALRIDQVGLEPAPGALPLPASAPPQPAVPGAGGRIQISDKGISVIGHIERTGDVVASNGQRLGDPSTSLRLEGFQVMWPDRPAGVDLAYGIAVEGMGATPVVQTGKFCGTRGKALRITEVSFALVGPQATQFRLEGTAHFTGGFQMPLVSGMAASGPSGLEHLTALTLRVLAATPAATAANPWDESPKTKVFKSKAPAAVKPAARKVAGSTTAKVKQTK
ncbi:hypothetical protein ACFSQU_17280 [Massilia sp. GCM10020059]|uniref:AsmA-like C-terminal domain-containing protein n=1 Tax=Massilia agrisoli TaxID=2892444 RepID=A0ABS8ITT2_9BURK|nr:hypothetical protein [Massilia agrisoli]MCC6071291.1 hypothetical protein [Massilia agrisoli]